MDKVRKYAYVVVILFIALISSCSRQNGQPVQDPLPSPTIQTIQTFKVESCEDVQDGTKCVYMDDPGMWYFPNGIHKVDVLYNTDFSGESYIPAEWCNQDKIVNLPCITQDPDTGDMTVTTDK